MNVKPPKGMRSRFRNRLTKADIARIVRLTQQHVPQNDIARALRCTVHTVRKWQQRRLGGMRRLGSMRRPLDDVAEKEILALAENGWGYRRIAKQTGFAYGRVLQVMREHGVTQKVGGPYLPKDKQKALDAAIQTRANYCVRIAKDVGVGTETARRRAHALLGPGRFLSAPVWPPLQSYFPQLQSYVEQQVTAPTSGRVTVEGDGRDGRNYFLEIVGRFRDTCFGGTVPAVADAVFVEAMLHCFTQTTLHGQPQPILDCFAAGLAEAVRTLRQEESAQTGLVH